MKALSTNLRQVARSSRKSLFFATLALTWCFSISWSVVNGMSAPLSATPDYPAPAEIASSR